MSKANQNGRSLIKLEKNPGIFKRGNSYIVIYYERKTGKQRKRSFRTLLEARRFKGGLAAGQPAPGARIKLRSYAETFTAEYNGRSGNGLAPSTRAGYEDAIQRVLVPHLGNLYLEDIGPQEAKRLAAELSKSYAPSSVRRYLAVLKVVIATANEDGILAENRIRDVRTPTTRADYDKRSRQLTKDQTRAILHEIPEEHYDLVYTLAATGMRIGEALGLRWGDVIEGKDGATVIQVRRETTKSHAGVRALQLTARNAELLRARRAAAGNPSPHAPVFPSRFGNPMDQHNFRQRVFKPAAKRAGIPGAVPHMLRHGLASLMAAEGCSPSWIAAQLGHSDGGVTAMRFYIHPEAQQLPQAIDEALSV